VLNLLNRGEEREREKEGNRKMEDASYLLFEK
jgi:hypothetical protein